MSIWLARDTGYTIESGELSYDPLDRSELSGVTRDVPDACGSKFPRRSGGLTFVFRMKNLSPFSVKNR